MKPPRKLRALVASIAPIGGGVPRMAAYVCARLRDRGLDPVIAYYQPYSLSPRLSVPAYRLLQRRIGHQATTWRGCEAHALGAWMPELEFTHYLPTRPWRELADSCSLHLAVTGNCLAAAPYALSGRPFWAWVATPWAEDRADRARTFPWYRRWLDATLTAHAVRRLERRILASGTIVALSRYTRDALNRCADGNPVRHVMPMGIDVEHFKPRGVPQPGPRIGFVGRYDDPRKNMRLLFDALAWCRERGQRVTAVLAGEVDDTGTIEKMLQGRGIRDQVELRAVVDHEALPGLLSGLSAFVVPSHQEGLCIAALEAMACGVPVVSTRCGGPDDYVQEGRNGFVVDAAAAALGQRILDIALNENLRASLGANAREQVMRHYSPRAVDRTFDATFEEVFPVARAA